MWLAVVLQDVVVVVCAFVARSTGDVLHGIDDFNAKPPPPCASTFDVEKLYPSLNTSEVLATVRL